MQRAESGKRMLFVVASALAVVAAFFVGDGSVGGYLNDRREALAWLVHENYAEAVLIFMLLYMGTALLLPGALVLTVTGGMLFGTIPAVIYVNISATLGATAAFLVTRLLIGKSIQKHFNNRLKWINSQITKHGANYLISLRILPVLPFFLVNYCAALTTIRFRTFVWTTSLGMLPGSLIYAFAGQELGSVTSAGDFFSGRIFVSLLLLSLFSLLPVIVNNLKSWSRRRK